MSSCGLHVAAERFLAADPSDINSRDGLPLFLEIMSLPFFIKASATLILKLNKSFCFEFETPKESQSRLYRSHPFTTATSIR